MATTTTVLMTADDLAALPDDERGELIDGVYHPTAPRQRPEGRLVARLSLRVGSWVEERGLGETGLRCDFLLRRDPDAVLAPDVYALLGDRAVLCDDAPGFTELAPDLAVEVVSSGDTASEMLRKTAIYLDAGVRMLWIVDPESRLVVVHTANGISRTIGIEDILDGGDVLPGFTLALADLFA